MSRDVLLALLALALLVNLAFLSQVVTLRARRERSGALNRDDEWRREAARRAAISRTAPPELMPGATARTFFVPARDGNGSGRAAATDDPASTTHGNALAAAVDTVDLHEADHAHDTHDMAALAVAPSVGEPSTRTPHDALATDDEPRVAATSLDPATVTSSSDAGPRKTRGRRFVLPPLDEDQDRSAAAIEAFLGGPPPPPGATAERPQRRRHRVRRAAGTPVPRTTMLVWLQGFGDLDRAVGTSRANHVSNAFNDALRRSARATDEIREAGAGRVRLIIDADDAGASAYVERARASVQPWLELLSVPLRVESGARQSTEVIPFAGSRRAVGDH
jgi:hypothetical protein